MGGTPISHRQELRKQRIVREADGSVACCPERSEKCPKTERGKFICRELSWSSGMGGTPISHRQELRKQRIVCEAERRPVACCPERSEKLTRLNFLPGNAILKRRLQKSQWKEKEKEREETDIASG